MALRLFWFIAGAGTATWWMKHHENAHSQGALDWHSRWHSKCPTEEINGTEVPRQQLQQPEVNVRRWSWNSTGWDDRQLPKADELAKMKDERVDQLTRAMGDFSEATLDSLLTTMIGLKSKLAEHRAQREAEMDRLRKEGPPRWV